MSLANYNNRNDLQTIWNNLRKEAKAMQNVSHINLCRFHGLSSSFGDPFLVMEYISGHTLQNFMHLKHEKSLSEKVKLRMALQISKGLEYLHCMSRIVHGDFCPNNIMVKNDGKQTIKIVDFGLARSTEGTTGGTTTSRNGHVNIRYEAPEMCQLGTKENFETDIYAYGGVLNFIWTKEHPWSQVKNSRIAQSQIIKLQTENSSM